MKPEHWIALAGVIATVVIGVISWFVSAAIARRGLRKRQLSYRMSIEPLLMNPLPNEEGKLEIRYNGELLPEPVLLSVDIINSGNQAVEGPPIEIEAMGTSYIIPAYIEDPPPGYEDLWDLERTDAESCAINCAHINKGQMVKARFFMDEIPSTLPEFKCPMPDVEIKPLQKPELNAFLSAILKATEPTLLDAIRALK